MTHYITIEQFCLYLRAVATLALAEANILAAGGVL
jgi:hypothetical protein